MLRHESTFWFVVKKIMYVKVLESIHDLMTGFLLYVQRKCGLLDKKLSPLHGVIRVFVSSSVLVGVLQSRAHTH